MSEPKKRNQYAYDKEKYDHIHVQLPKGRKARYQKAAARRDESLNAFIYRAMYTQLMLDNKEAIALREAAQRNT